MGQKILTSSERAAPVVSALEQFNGSIFGKHHPIGACFTCVDGREEAGGYLPFAEDVHVLRFTKFAGIVPKYELASYETRGMLSFRKLKGVPVIKIIGHSFCGAAQLAIQHPSSQDAPDEEVHNIIHCIEDSGADIPRLRDAFLKATEGDAVHAANLLSRHLVVVSLDNISKYPHINEQVMSHQLDVIPLYHMIKEDTGELSHLERFDVAHQRWFRLDEGVISNMCERPDNCQSCGSCHETIDKSLSWVPTDFINDNGEIDSVEVPFHISRLIQERRDHYQPQLHDVMRDRIVAQPVRFYPSREIV